MFISSREIQVLYADTDMMGVIYHANYLKYFEVGRVGLMEDAGYSYVEMEDLVTLLLCMMCKQPIRNQFVTEIVRLSELGLRKMMELKQFMVIELSIIMMKFVWKVQRHISLLKRKISNLRRLKRFSLNGLQHMRK